MIYYIPPTTLGSTLPALIEGDVVEIDKAWNSVGAALAAVNATIPMGETTLRAVDTPSPNAVWVGQ